MYVMYFSHRYLNLNPQLSMQSAIFSCRAALDLPEMVMDPEEIMNDMVLQPASDRQQSPLNGKVKTRSLLLMDRV